MPSAEQLKVANNLKGPAAVLQAHQLLVIPSPTCVRPVCPELDRPCDILWLREDTCRGSSVHIWCSVLSQVCTAPGVCAADVMRCSDPCDRSMDSCGKTPRTELPLTLTWPVPASFRILRHFGDADADVSCGVHTGLDIGAPHGSTVVAMASGKVVHVGPLWVAGANVGRGPWTVVLQHAPGMFSVYSHNSKSLVAPGLCVEAGQPIALVGREGYARDTDHLHVELVDDPTGALAFASWPVPFYNACRYYQDLSKPDMWEPKSRKT